MPPQMPPRRSMRAIEWIIAAVIVAASLTVAIPLAARDFAAVRAWWTR